MKEKIIKAVESGVEAVSQLKEPPHVAFLERAAAMIADCFSRGNKLLLAGNGGSLCDAAHFAEELTGVFREKRRALPALCLSEPGHLTCVGNDLGYAQIFSRGIEAFGRPGDIFVGLTTSGNSPNMVAAFETAAEYQLKTIAFLGKGGGKLKGKADLEMEISGCTTSDRIQEAHMTAIHIIIEMVEELLFYAPNTRKILDEILTTLSR